MVMASPPESYAMIARMATRDVLWAAWDGRGFEHLRLEIEADRVRADSLIVAGGVAGAGVGAAPRGVRGRPRGGGPPDRRGGRGRPAVPRALSPRMRRGLDD